MQKSVAIIIDFFKIFNKLYYFLNYDGEIDIILKGMRISVLN